MNILLANIQWDHTSISENLEKMTHLHFPLGLALIAGEIMRHRTDTVSVVDNYIDTIGEKDILHIIKAQKIDALLVSMFLGNYQYAYVKKFITRTALEFPDLKIIVGGPLPSTVGDLLIKNTSGLHEQIICVLGEGEKTILELLECIEHKGDLSRVAGICYKSDRIHSTPARERLKDLDSGALPAYSLFNIEKYVSYVKKTNRCWEMVTSRGCYGSCSYCKLVFGKTITKKSVTHVVKEMEDFYAKYGVNKFNFVDDNFLNNRQQIVDFHSALKKSPVHFQWRFQGRADCFTPDFAVLLQEVGLYDVSFGLESGSSDILNQMSKNMRLDLVRKNLKSLPNDLKTHGSFIVGMPAESPETIADTIAFIKETGLQYAGAGILTLFPGTKIYAYDRDKGFIPDEDTYCENLGPVYVKPYVNLTRYPDEQLLAWATLINNSGSIHTNSIAQ
ncbi:MAG TPA: radical SAM protein [Candidatus Omnitrophota bacterium]|nr:radical SAM protein [Candidatus Omnitrophota bacterium]